MEETKMFKAKIQVKQNDEVKWEYLFSDTTKDGLFRTTINYFHGYISAMADFTKMTLQAPSVMSLDGYHAWSNGSGFTVRLLNENGDIIAKVDDTSKSKEENDMTIYQAHKKAISMLKKAYPVESGKYWCVEINHYSADDVWVTIRASFNWNKEGLYESVEDHDTDKFIAKLQEYIDQNPIKKD